MILSLLNDLNEDEGKEHKETVFSGVAAAAYTGMCLIWVPFGDSILTLEPNFRGF